MDLNIQNLNRALVNSFESIGRYDIMTVDLFLQKNNVWGEYTRTIVIENGRVTGDVEDIYYFEKSY